MTKTEKLQTTLDGAYAQGLIGNYYRHYKGGVYFIDGFVIDTDNDSVRVLNTRVDGPGFDEDAELGIQFARPIAEFSQLTDDGQPRFVRVREQRAWVEYSE